MTGDIHKALRLPSSERWRAPSRTYPTGRTCPDCGSVLSTYNPGPTCYAHAETIAPETFGRQASRKRKDAP
jgi:hypothetical protein